MLSNSKSSSYYSGITYENTVRPEFQELGSYYDSLRLGYTKNTIFGSGYLLQIRSLLETCDNLKADRSEETVLFGTYGLWEKCRRLWLTYKPMTETADIPSLKLSTKKSPAPRTEEPNIPKPPPVKENQALAGPNKKWEEILTLNDRRFLRSLHIASGDELIYPEDNKKDKDN